MKSITVIQGILFTTYFVLKMIQTFMYAWSGSCLIEEVILEQCINFVKSHKDFNE